MKKCLPVSLCVYRRHVRRHIHIRYALNRTSSLAKVATDFSAEIFLRQKMGQKIELAKHTLVDSFGPKWPVFLKGF